MASRVWNPSIEHILHFGPRPFSALYTSSNTLKSIIWFTRSQCSCLMTGVIWSISFATAPRDSQRPPLLFRKVSFLLSYKWRTERSPQHRWLTGMLGYCYSDPEATGRRSSGVVCFGKRLPPALASLRLRLALNNITSPSLSPRPHFSFA